MTNLAPEVFCWSSNTSFSTALPLTGLEFDPEEGERKAMNEFFLIVLSCFVLRCWLLKQIHVKKNTLITSMGWLNGISAPGMWMRGRAGGRRGCGPPGCFFIFCGPPDCFLSPSGDLGIGLVWDNHPDRTGPTFWSDCWNPLQTELNYLWGLLSCSQDDIAWL